MRWIVAKDSVGRGKSVRSLVSTWMACLWREEWSFDQSVFILSDAAVAAPPVERAAAATAAAAGQTAVLPLTVAAQLAGSFLDLPA